MDLKTALGVARLNLAMTRGIEYSHQQRCYVAVDGTPQAVEAAEAYNVLAASDGVTCEVLGVTYDASPAVIKRPGNVCIGCAGDGNALCSKLDECVHKGVDVIWIARTPSRRFCDCR